MANGSHSEKMLNGSTIDFVNSEEVDIEAGIFPPNGYIDFVYGVLARCRMEDFRAIVCGQEYSEGEVQEIVDKLSSTGRSYSYEIIATDTGNSDHYEGLMVIGREIPVLMASGLQSSDSLVHGKVLEAILAEKDQILADLISIGFKDITADDLYLHANSYMD